MNKRIEKLRKKFINNSREVDINRAITVTEVYSENEEKPQIIKKALTLKKLFKNLDISIDEGEIIVGDYTKKIRGVPLFPEYAVEWILDQMDTFPTRKGDQFEITEEDKSKLNEVLPYWQGKSLRAKINQSLPSKVEELLNYNVFTNQNYTMSGPGHMVPDYKSVIENGLLNFRNNYCKKQGKLDIKDIDYEEKYHLYEAGKIVCDSIISFANRYAKLAESLAENTNDEKRKEELYKISEICNRVPAKPARNFWEAMQSIYFMQLAIMYEANGLAIAFGRLDQILYPYYKRNVNDGMQREKFMELLEAFYLKISEIDKIYSNQATRYLQGPGHGQTITLGGVDSNGRDATNELSYLFLEADDNMKLVQPQMAVRVHNKSPRRFIKKAAINMKEGVTKPKLFTDEVVIKSLLNINIPLKEARDWAALGCSEPLVVGKTNSWGNSGHINIAKCLELSINEGKCMLTGKQMVPKTWDLNNIEDFDDFMDIFRSNLDYFIKYLVAYDNIIDRAHQEFAPLPTYSMVIKDCMENGTEFNKGGARYNTTGPLGVGPITTGDSLASIKKVVFEDERFSLNELKEILKNDFQNKENIRQLLVNKPPKFGNDIDYVDELCNKVLNCFCSEMNKYENPRGGPYIGAFYYLTANIPFGEKTAATPDGRKAGTPLNDGGISPVHGRDENGITAVAKSVGKLDNEFIPHGAILNQRLHPSVFKGEDALEAFVDYLRTFTELKGYHTQFNVVSTEDLKEAKKNPEDYKDLVVRVAGYSAYFTQLEEELQDDIIDRTEHGRI